MNWTSIGSYKLPSGARDGWNSSHAQLPTVLCLDDSSVRVFFATRSEEQVSSIGFVDLFFNASDSFEIVNISKKPVLAPGETGFFDEHGVFPSCVIPFGGKYYLYYVGWNRGFESPLFYASIGLAVSDDGLNFKRHTAAPLLSRSEHDPCLITSPTINLISDDKWVMHYTSGVRWSRKSDGKLQSHYHIKSAQSNNPLDWRRDGSVAVDFDHGETNIARPSVIQWDEGGYGMWFSFVHSELGKYRMGYAESRDAYSWTRRDDLAGIDIGDDLATDMICYPCVFRLNGEVFMLYNGDNFGAKGFGVAKLESN